MSKSTVSRRQVLFAVAGTAAAGLAAGWWVARPKPQSSAMVLAADAAYGMMINNELTLIDIRRPKEWAKTGVAAGANRLDMRRKDFVAQLDALVGKDRSTPIGLICATGGRSRWLSSDLAKAGYSQVFDISEGMMGSRAGPGWLKRGLPVVR